MSKVNSSWRNVERILEEIHESEGGTAMYRAFADLPKSDKLALQYYVKGGASDEIRRLFDPEPIDRLFGAIKENASEGELLRLLQVAMNGNPRRPYDQRPGGPGTFNSAIWDGSLLKSALESRVSGKFLKELLDFSLNPRNFIELLRKNRNREYRHIDLLETAIKYQAPKGIIDNLWDFFDQNKQGLNLTDEKLIDLFKIAIESQAPKAIIQTFLDALISRKESLSEPNMDRLKLIYEENQNLPSQKFLE